MKFLTDALFTLAARREPDKYDPAHMPHAVHVHGFGEMQIQHSRKDLFDGQERPVVLTGPRRVLQARLVQAPTPEPADVSRLAARYKGAVPAPVAQASLWGAGLGLCLVWTFPGSLLALGAALVCLGLAALAVGLCALPDPTPALQAAVEQAAWQQQAAQQQLAARGPV